MSDKIYKNYQVNLGVPFQVKVPINFDTIKKINTVERNKAGITPSIDEDVPEDILQAAHDEAETIVKEAHLESLRLIEEAEKEADEHRKNIENEARQKGYEDGINQARQEYEGLLQQAEQTREQAEVEYREVTEGLEANAVDMILEIARKVISEEVSINKDNVLYLLRNAFESCTNRECVVFKVSPEDYDFVTANREKLLSMLEGAGDFEIKKDFGLKAGACILETPFGSIDAGIQTRLSKIEEAFKEVIGNKQA